MKILRMWLAIAMIVQFFSCSSQTSEAGANKSTDFSDKIEAYYFHFTARCVTCRTVEAQAKQHLETLYPDEFRQGLITFQSVNLEDPAGKALAQKLGVGGQSLLLVKADQKINITSEGFMYAMTAPEKFKKVINEKVNGLLNR